jgi:hypothetical protein
LFLSSVLRFFYDVLSIFIFSRFIFLRPRLLYVFMGAWGGLVVKALRYWSEGPGIDPRSLGIFSGASDSSMCPGIDSASKNEYQDIPGGKDLTTF